MGWVTNKSVKGDRVLIHQSPGLSVPESSFQGATPQGVRVIQDLLRRLAPVKVRGFELLYWDPSDFSEKEITLANAKIFFIAGGYCTGKTTVLRRICEGCENVQQIPEVKTRALRADEQPGREVECINQMDFIESMWKGEFLIAYRANLGQRKHLVAIRKETFRQAIAWNGYSGIIMHPHAVMTFLQTFWIKTFIMHAAAHERSIYRTMRGVNAHDSRSQTEFGGFEADSIYLPREYCITIHNPMNGQEEATAMIATSLMLPSVRLQEDIDASLASARH
jgi:hypothetical protein